VETIHGHEVADPYRWLEDLASTETQTWLAAEDALTSQHLAALPGRDHLRRRLRELVPGMIGPPQVVGGRSFFIRRQAEQDHAVLWVADPDGTERALVDPNALSADGTVTLDGWTPSFEGDRLAYLLSQGGDEESALHVIDVITGGRLDGPIDRTRYSPVAWLPGGEELFYVRRLPPDDVPKGDGQFHRRVYRHAVGADPRTDALLFGEGDDKTAYYGLETSRDGRWLVVSRSLGTAPRNDVYIADLAARGDAPTFRTIQEGDDCETHAFVHTDGPLYIHTSRDAERWRLCVADPAHPEPDEWRELVAESDGVLDDIALTDDALVIVTGRHAVSHITVHDKTTGELRAGVELPGLGFAGVNSRPEGGDDVWVGYTDFVTPYRVLHYDVASGALTPWADPPGAIEIKGIATEQHTYQSPDGTDVRLFLLHRDDVVPDGARPTILYGYGGFNNPMMPAYSSNTAAWVEAGGVYAIACIRGGSEEGEAWHRAGMRDKKQNVFDDFLAAAHWLIDERWTSPDHLGISGGSNGGLLVGAALTQRPDLFASVVCSAPLLDMVRYERFGLGVTWNDEYGTADDPEEFGWLIGYSPYHRVVGDTRYPAVLFTVFDSDTRVDPNHARKMCAALQAATSSDPAARPVLFRREVNVGHGARSVSRTVHLGADTGAFHAAQLGLALPTA
jgi:prolyl oligopeptidase